MWTREEGDLPEVRAGYGMSGLSWLQHPVWLVILGLSTTQDVLGEGEMEGGKKRSRVIELAVICEDAGILPSPQQGCFLAALNQGVVLGIGKCGLDAPRRRGTTSWLGLVW